MLPHMRVTLVRRYAFWFSVAAYLAACPIVFMFAFGIRVAPTVQPAIIETASLEVTTVPANAWVSLAGRKARRSPIVFDDLAPGGYAITVVAGGALPWQGSLDVRAGIAYSIPQLRMVSSRRPSSSLSVQAATDAVALRDGRSFAYLEDGGARIVLCTPRRERLEQERFELPAAARGRGARLSRLEASGDLAATWVAADGVSWMLALRVSDPVLPARLLQPPRVVPPNAIAVVSAGSELSEGMVVVEPQGLARYAASGTRTLLVRFSGGLRAYGEAHGRLYMLDAAGTLSQYGLPIIPSRVASFAPPAALADGGGGPWRIVAASEDTVACVSPALRELVICGPDGASVHDGYDGACPSETRGEFWAWSGSALLVSRGGKAPRRVAGLEGRILGVKEGFIPQHLAIETDACLALLPAISAQESAVRFDPLVLYAVPPSARVTACAEGGFLVQGPATGALQAFQTEPPR
jgi:hypothetical protein